MSLKIVQNLLKHENTGSMSVLMETLTSFMIFETLGDFRVKYLVFKMSKKPLNILLRYLLAPRSHVLNLRSSQPFGAINHGAFGKFQS